MRYIISDIHGCKKEYLELLRKIKFSDEDHLYILGDVLDRSDWSFVRCNESKKCNTYYGKS